MLLKIVTLPEQEKWECHQCGVCCRGSIVPLDKEDLAQLVSQHWENDPEYRKLKTTALYSHAQTGLRLAHRDDGACVFLNPEGLCRIHQKYGHNAKPLVCRVFPLQIIPQDRSAVLTFRRSCPSAAADLGRPAIEYLPEVKKWLESGRIQSKMTSAPMFKPKEQRDWKTVQFLLDSIASLWSDQRYPPVRRVVHALVFAKLLLQAKTSNLSDEKLRELVKTLAQLVSEESKPYFDHREQPSPTGRVLFRSICLEYARLHPSVKARKNWQERIKLAWNGLKLIRGSRLPDLAPAFPCGKYSDLEVSLGVVPLEVDAVLTRYLETTSASFSYAIAERSEWSILESLLGLATWFPVGLWLMRWISIGKTPAVDDMISIVVSLERGQGASPLSGQLHRRRLQMLLDSDDLIRLAIWYAQ